MNRWYSFLKFISRRKYLIVSVLGIEIIGFVGENSIMKHVQNRMLVREIKKEINAYNTQYEKDEHMLKELQRNPKAIPIFARELFSIKADVEDIFLMRDDNDTKENDNETTE